MPGQARMGQEQGKNLKRAIPEIFRQVLSGSLQSRGMGGNGEERRDEIFCDYGKAPRGVLPLGLQAHKIQGDRNTMEKRHSETNGQCIQEGRTESRFILFADRLASPPFHGGRHTPDARLRGGTEEEQGPRHPEIHRIHAQSGEGNPHGIRKN